MREMKDSGIEWIGEIPNHWKIEKAKYDFYNTKTIVGNKVNEYQRLALTMNGVISRSKEDNTGLQPEKFETYQILKKNELVFKLIDLQNVSTSRVGLSKADGLVSPAYIIIHSNGAVLPNFAEKWFINLWKTQVFNHIGDDGVRSSLNSSDLLNIPIAFPETNEQQRISAYLDRKCSEIDALTADIQNQIDILQQYKRSTITEAVTKGLNSNAEIKNSGSDWMGNIPDLWQMVKGKYLFSQRSQRGNTIEVQLLSPTQKFGVIPQKLYEELSGMSAVKLNDNVDFASMKTIHKGDYCISLRSFQGGFEYSTYEGVVSPAYQVFYPIVEIADGYYKYLFKEDGFIEKMNSYTMTLRDGKNIAFSDFGNTYIPYPPIVEQNAIAEFLDMKCSEIDKVIADKNEQLNTIDDYKKSLIYEYVTGKKEVPSA